MPQSHSLRGLSQVEESLNRDGVTDLGTLFIAGCFQVHKKACLQIRKRLNTVQVEHFHNLLDVALASSSLHACFQVRRKSSSKSENVMPWQLAHSLLRRLASKIISLFYVS